MEISSKFNIGKHNSKYTLDVDACWIVTELETPVPMFHITSASSFTLMVVIRESNVGDVYTMAVNVDVFYKGKLYNSFTTPTVRSLLTSTEYSLEELHRDVVMKWGDLGRNILDSIKLSIASVKPLGE